jgi:hypothetical protein
MTWWNAIGSKSDPPNKTGFIYMLAGDTGTSNHDPYQRNIASALGADRSSCDGRRPDGSRNGWLLEKQLPIRRSLTRCFPAQNTNT